MIVGYPQKEGNKYYNSLCCVDPQGNLIKTYQKCFLFETDEQWATEGSGFVSMEMDGLGKVIVIQMTYILFSIYLLLLLLLCHRWDLAYVWISTLISLKLIFTTMNLQIIT